MKIKHTTLKGIKYQRLIKPDCRGCAFYENYDDRVVCDTIINYNKTSCLEANGSKRIYVRIREQAK